MGAMENTRPCFMGEQPNQWYNPQAQVGGAPAGQDHRLHGGFHLRVETPDLWVVVVGRGVHRQGSMEIRDKHLVRQVVIKEIQDELYRHNNYNSKLQSKQDLRQGEKYQARL